MNALQSQGKSVGEKLRLLRRNRGLTLQDTCVSLNISPPTLSRIERGEKEIDRQTLQSATQAYQLTPWEAYDLWTTAGMVPDLPGQSTTPAINMQTFAQSLLHAIPYPACLLDAMGYIQAWNHQLAHIHILPSARSQPIHLMDGVFAEQTRQELDLLWDQYAWRMVGFFYHRTLPIARQTSFLALINTLAKRYGTAFLSRWREVQRIGCTPHESNQPYIIPCLTQEGIIEFLMMRSIIHVPADHDLITLIPMNAISRERYQRYCAQT